MIGAYAGRGRFAEYVDQRRQSMVRQLPTDVERRSPLSGAWRRAFLRAPRHLFVERIHSNGSVYRRTDRYWRHWLDLVYDERQVTCLASMLSDLDVADEHRVLLVGAGTGYACAVLCERLSPARVKSVLVPREGLEPPTYCLEGSCSVH